MIPKSSPVRFFEKPGCINNTRQKKLLVAAGYRLDARSLLNHPWRVEELAAFFGDKPVASCFNRSSPRVKSGEVVPDQLATQEALALMVADPLLIRRPLIETDQGRTVGFDDLARIGLSLETSDQDLETCPRPLEPCIQEAVS